MTETSGQLLLDKAGFRVFNDAIVAEHGISTSDITDCDRSFGLQALRTGLAALASLPDKAISAVEVNSEIVSRGHFTEVGYRFLVESAISQFTLSALFGHPISIDMLNPSHPDGSEKVAVLRGHVS